jgi:hypothetical protein
MMENRFLNPYNQKLCQTKLQYYCLSLILTLNQEMTAVTVMAPETPLTAHKLTSNTTLLPSQQLSLELMTVSGLCSEDTQDAVHMCTIEMW